MPKIAMIGAGSLVFCKTLAMDILSTDALKNSEICLMSRTLPKLSQMEEFLKRVVKSNGLSTSISSTLDRREALDGADYVINMIQVGGVDAFQLDYEIPLRYGVDQCIGDSLGPGGVFRFLRTAPVLVEMVKDIEELCPNALFLNYTNPMGAVCQLLGRLSRSVQSIGLCHGVQTTMDLVAGYLGLPKEQVDYTCAGINHMAWFLSLTDKKTGEDLYPRFKQLCEQPEYYVNEKVRCEVMRHFGYFMTESTGHLSEYVPWFRSNERGLKTYCDEPAFGGESGAYYKFCRMIADKYKGVNYLDTESDKLGSRSNEFCSYILEAHETDRPFRLQGNVRNDGYITNLPNGACVEVPVYIDRHGVRPLTVGALPPQCAAMNQSNISVQSLAVEAALQAEPEHIVHAIAMDPLTSAVCTLPEIRNMVAEMLSAQQEWLPQFRARKLRSVAPVPIAPDLKRAKVPVDPALAIANRFGELAERAL